MKEVRLIGADGEQVGVVSTFEAMRMAQEADLDLVEISPTARPPVCRIMDFGKFKYEQSKKRDEQRRKQRKTTVKEVKFRPSTDEGDYDIKMRNIKRFLTEGNKVKVTMRFVRREMAHQGLGHDVLHRIDEELKDFANIEQHPRAEGRQLVMVIAPKKSVIKEQPAASGDGRPGKPPRPAAAKKAAEARPAPLDAESPDEGGAPESKA